jgi:hypothetical protein
MNLKYYFPELNDGQLKMLERYINQREQAAIDAFRRTKPQN